ncbi:MAG: Ig-like domain-containing protein, partial [Magnetococcales bacterium]|nr:Ig-like domain-containing protein [Magnetococcales bacterium]
MQKTLVQDKRVGQRGKVQRRDLAKDNTRHHKSTEGIQIENPGVEPLREPGDTRSVPEDTDADKRVGNEQTVAELATSLPSTPFTLSNEPLSSLSGVGADQGDAAESPAMSVGTTGSALPSLFGLLGSGAVGLMALGMTGGSAAAGQSDATVSAVGTGSVAPKVISGVVVASTFADKTGENSTVATKLVRVSDDYITGAKVYIDANNDGMAQASEFVGTTGAGGAINIAKTANGTLIAIGGINENTGLSNTIIMKATSDATVVNPITTVIQKYIQLYGATYSQAETAVKARLGIPSTVDLKTFDPLANTSNSVAITVQKVIAEIATVALSSTSTAAAIDTLVSAIYSGTGVLDLSNSATIAKIFPVSVLPAAALSSVQAAVVKIGGASGISDIPNFLKAGVTAANLAKGSVFVPDTSSDTSLISGTVADLLASKTLTTSINVVVSDKATLAQLATIDAKAGVVVPLGGVSDTAANLAANAGGYVAGLINVTVTDKASMAQLAAIAAKTSGTVTAAGGISDTAANLVANKGGFVTGGVTVTIIDTPTTAQVAAIKALTSLQPTYTAGKAVKISDGYVEGASVYVDVNNNGIPDPEEYIGKTDKNGAINIPEDKVGTVIVTGGINTDTGLPNTAVMKAPSGGAMVTPLTTLVQKLVEKTGLSPEAAQNSVKSILGIPDGVDLQTFDPLGVEANSADAAKALAVQKVGTQIATVGATAGNMSGVFNALAEKISEISTSNAKLGGSGGTTLDLGNSVSLKDAFSKLITDASKLEAAAAASKSIGQSSTLSGVASLQKSAVETARASDTKAPTLVSSTPADNKMDVGVHQEITLRFSEDILPGSGNIVIKSDTGTDVRTIAINDTKQIWVEGNLVVIHPKVALSPGTAYGVLIATGTVMDAAGNPYAGISDKTTLNFTTSSDVTAPTLSSAAPSDNATAIPTDSNIVLTFSEPVTAGVGQIVISNGTDVRTISVNDASQITFKGKEVIINPKMNLLANSDYSVTMTAGVITDVVGNDFAGVSGTATLNFSTEADATAPILVSSTPVDNGKGALVAAPIELVFSEAVARGTGSIIISDGAKDVRTISVMDAKQVKIDGDHVTITPTKDLHTSSTYSVQMASGVFDDLAGNHFAGIIDATTLNFTTAADGSAPTLVSVTPRDNAVGVDVNANIVLTFSEKVVAAPGGFILLSSSSDTRIIPVNDSTVSIQDNVLTINSAYDLVPGATYSVQIPSGSLTDVTGNAFSGIISKSALNFTTAKDTTAPTLVSSTPADEAATVGVDVPIVLNFSEAVNAGMGDIIITNGSDDVRTLSVSDASQVMIFGKEVILNPSNPLHADQTYSVQMAAGVLKDDSGNAFAGITDATTLNFHTSADAMPPMFVSATPSDHAGDVLAGANIVLTFSKDVVEGHGNIFIKSADGLDVRLIPVTDEAQVTVSGSTVTINPYVDLEPGVAYTIEMDAGTLKDASGNAFGGISSDDELHFTTAMDTTAPTLVSFSPSHGDASVALDAPIMLAFSKDVEAGYGSIVLRDDTGAETSIDVQDTSQVYVIGSMVMIKPTAGFAVGKTYSVSMDSGVLVDASGNAYAGTDGSEIDFGTVAESTAPTLVSSTPALDAHAVAVGADVVLTFSEDVVAGHGAIVIASESGDDVRFIDVTDTTQVTISGTHVTINPTVDLHANQNYFVSVMHGALEDTSGNAFAGMGSTGLVFKTVDTMAPMLVSSLPGDNDVNVGLNPDIVLTFSEDVVAGTGNIVISNGTDVHTIAVGDTSQVTIDGGVVTIHPTDALQGGSTYAVQMDAGVIEDMDGNTFTGIADTTTLNFNTLHTSGPGAPTINTIAGDDIITLAEIGSKITGTTDSGTSVTLLFGSVTHDATVTSTTWEYELQKDDIVALGSGSGSVVAVAVDVSGNLSSETSHTVHVDIPFPALSVDTVAGDDIISASEVHSVISGTTDAGAAVTLMLGDLEREATIITKVTSTGKETTWSYTLTDDDITAMGQGEDEIVVKATNALGITKVESHTVVVNTDGSGPVVTIDTIAGDDMITAGEENSIITGTTTAGTEVLLYMGQEAREATVTGTTWSYTLTNGDIASLGQGQTSIWAVATDTATQKTGYGSHAVMVDTLDATSKVSIDTVAGDDIVTLSELTSIITGTTANGSSVTLYVGGFERDATVVDGSGHATWSYTLDKQDISALGKGTATITAVAMDENGNFESQTSRDVTLDIPLPGVAIHTVAGDDIIGANETNSVISGSVETGSTVELLIGGTQRTATVSDDTWTYTLTTEDIDTMGQGSVTILATATNSYGIANTVTHDVLVSTNGTGPTVSIDTVASDDTITAEEAGNVHITGTTVENSTVELTIGGITRAADVSGTTFSYTLTSEDITNMGQGSETIWAVVHDSDGHVGGATREITVDTLAVADKVSIDPIAGDDIISLGEQNGVITGFAANGSKVVLDIGGFERDATVMDGDGHATWSYTLVDADISNMGSGSDAIIATAYDANGFVMSAAQREVTIDIAAPGVTINTVAGDDIINAGEETSVITGSVAAGSSVSLLIGNEFHDATVSGETWSYTLTEADVTALGSGSHTIVATATNSLGITGEVSRDIMVDTEVSPPADITAPVFVSAEVNGNILVMTYSDASQLDAANGPANSNFNVLVNG